MKLTRRCCLVGGGVTFALPLLESLLPRHASARGETADPFAVFFRQANGVACALGGTAVGDEPERFWPREHGPLTPANVEGRAVGELETHLHRLLVVENVNMNRFDYGDGHARGALQGLTARGAVVAGVGGQSEAAGESIDHRIGADLNEGGRESLFMYAGRNSGWLGGACISYRAAGVRRAALHNPVNAYQVMMGLNDAEMEQIIGRQRSVNDFVLAQMQDLLATKGLSADDRRRLELHRDSVRDLEGTLSCNFGGAELAEVQELGAVFDSEDGTQTLATARAHMHVAALAIACGYTRSAAIQVGSGNDGNTRYADPDTGELMGDNFHYISHRRQSHNSEGTVIPGSDLLHHKVDVQFARTFRYLLDRLEEYETPGGGSLLDAGVAIWYNDNGSGPGHASHNIPYVLAGGAGGFLKQGIHVRVEADAADREPNHSKMLNTLGSAAGVRKADGGYLDDFGDPLLSGGLLTEILA
ncbi:MAG: DUF1552 domain-containing protein [Nannocystaceae bacterium]